MLNITLPCLLFSKIVPAFTSDNVRTLGPLVLVAVLYEILGVIIAWVVKQFFWVPYRFRHGILVAGGWGNVGDVPTSVVMGITGAAPFNGTSDQNLSVAYISAFMLVFFVTLFPCGGHRWIAMDYVGPDIESEEVKAAIHVKRKAILYGWMRTISLFFHSRCMSRHEEDDLEVKAGEEKKVEDDNMSLRVRQSMAHGKHVSADDPTTFILSEGALSHGCTPCPTEIGVRSQSPVTSPEPTIVPDDTHAVQRTHHRPEHLHLQLVVPTQKPSSDGGRSQALSLSSERTLMTTKKILTFSLAFLKSLVTPASVSIILSFPIALIPSLKALFVQVPLVHMPSAPDGLPPLAFFFDTTAFIGAASVPLGLICLGSALARLNVPKDKEGWRTLPVGAITGIAVGKIIIMPVLGVLLVQGLVKGGVIPRQDKVLQFVCMFCSCLPTATTQVFLTQVYSGTGTAEHLSAFLIPQYLLMFVSMTALTAYTLHLLF